MILLTVVTVRHFCPGVGLKLLLFKAIQKCAAGRQSKTYMVRARQSWLVTAGCAAMNRSRVVLQPSPFDAISSEPGIQLSHVYPSKEVRN
jgi:hypothetical protein